MGYVNFSRSVRSQEAIEDYEMPISLFNKDVIKDFTNEIDEDFSDEELDFLKSISVKNWKFVAKEKIRPSSWHHTSSKYNKTDHYSLVDVANWLIENRNNLDDELKHEVSNHQGGIKYGYIKVQIWGGSTRRPRIIGYDCVAGIVKGDWIYFKEGKDTKKYKTTANKVVEFKTFESYADLTKNHKEFKNTKKKFNQLIKETIK